MTDATMAAEPSAAPLRSAGSVQRVRPAIPRRTGGKLAVSRLLDRTGTTMVVLAFEV